MYEKIDLNDIQLILTKDDFGFKDVITSFSASSSITIVTYSIHKELLSALYNLAENKKIIIVTNIPGRFENYKSDSQRKSAKNKIDLTQHILDTSKFKAFTTTYLNFNNHSKIILSDTVAYIGSQNFYGMSSWEGGTLIKSKSVIEQIKDNFVNKILDNSLPYNYKYDLSHLDNILEVVKDLEKDFEEHLGASDLQYYNCGVYDESIALKKEELLYIVGKFLNVCTLIYNNETPTEIKDKFNICAYSFFENLKYVLNLNNLTYSKTDIYSINYCALLHQVLHEINTRTNHFYEFYSVDSIENLICSISELNLSVEEYIITFYRFKENGSLKQIEIDNTKD